jgi:hypothetical protein
MIEGRYAVGALIQIGRGRSLLIASRAGRFGKAVGPGSVLCGVCGLARRLIETARRIRELTLVAEPT